MSLPWMPRRRLIRAAVSEDGFPVVADFNTSNSTGTGTSSTVALPEDISAGDWLLIALGAEWTGSYDTPSGYVEVVQDNTAASPRAALAIFAREADGNEGASVSVSHSQFARTIHHSYRITGAAGAPAGEIDDGDSDAPNPPNLTPGGGSAKRLWLPFAANSPPRNVTGYPEGYEGALTHIAPGSSLDSGNRSRLSSAWRHSEAASETPGAFALSDEAAWVSALVVFDGA